MRLGMINRVPTFPFLRHAYKIQTTVLSAASHTSPARHTSCDVHRVPLGIASGVHVHAFDVVDCQGAHVDDRRASGMTAPKTATVILQPAKQPLSSCSSEAATVIPQERSDCREKLSTTGDTSGAKDRDSIPTRAQASGDKRLAELELRIKFGIRNRPGSRDGIAGDSVSRATAACVYVPYHRVFPSSLPGTPKARNTGVTPWRPNRAH
ncbi:MAG: hypothetical protein JWM95_3195 [Gemmatimonadetes bacterium]|nr:hypothetical protein [Gemmatimonadota bacterium]